jgi:hypothetical protein
MKVLPSFMEMCELARNLSSRADTLKTSRMSEQALLQKQNTLKLSKFENQ